ncbi:hypothetical protein CDD80_70 [Ophiocordyceps camponoti-rufipedis]|uniref:Uncharacterized protein n=1 Tax=Ophiocordyceps camponoti-rufipedis TaxID=2004952 RepID=A0A2C5ZLQ9_9HYPO|nr:hypothetical protein CDD80_70 [Ophiocordyceps camponoti-rufipedis]
MKFSPAGLPATFLLLAPSAAFFFWPLIVPIPIIKIGGGNKCSQCPAPKSNTPNCPPNPAYDKRQKEIASCSGSTAFFNADWSFSKCA